MESGRYEEEEGGGGVSFELGKEKGGRKRRPGLGREEGS